MLVSDAYIVMPMRTIDIFIASFPRKIVFGRIQNKKFTLKHSIIFDLSNIKVIYTSIMKIITNFAKDQLDSPEVSLLAEYDSYKYMVKMSSSETVNFEITIGSVLQSAFSFDYTQFNEFLFILSEIFLSCLSLKEDHTKFLSFLSNQDFKTIFDLQESSKADSFLEKHKVLDACNYKLLILHYIDVIIIVHKFKSFTNVQLLPNKIDFLQV